jgi:colicin import membrane protein
MVNDSATYRLPAVLAVLLHLSVVGIFLIEWPDSPRDVTPPPPHVMAQIIKQESKVVEQQRETAMKKAEEDRRRAEKLKADQEAKLAEQKLQEQKKAEQDKKLAEQKKAEQDKKLAEQKKAEQDKKLAEQKKAEQDKKLAEQKKAEQDKKLAEQKKAEQDKKLADQKKREKDEQQLMEQMAIEQAARELAEREQAEQNAKLAAEAEADAASMIRDQVQRSWRYPPNVNPQQRVTVRITTVPTGEVTSVTVVQGSGNTALDRSVEQAVLKASPLPVPSDIRVYEQSFRTFTMEFRPENATW